MIRNRHRAYLFLLLVGLIAAGFASCHQSNTNPRESAGPATASRSPQPTPQSAFERDLQYIRNGGFKYIWVFSRKDGKPLDRDDSDYLRKTAPQVVDWATEDPRKVVAGTNFDLELGNMALLKKRFVVEDYTGK